MAHSPTTSFRTRTSTHRVREFVCAYRSLRDRDGRVIGLPTLVLSTPRTAASTLAPPLRDEPVEVFAVACLSTRHRLLSWHVLSRGTRASTPVSIPDVFVPACLTPGTTGLIVLHNHPSGDAVPSADDVALTTRLRAAAVILDIEVLDHLIVGEGEQYYSFREAGQFGSPAAGASGTAKTCDDSSHCYGMASGHPSRDISTAARHELQAVQFALEPVPHKA